MHEPLEKAKASLVTETPTLMFATRAKKMQSSARKTDKGKSLYPRIDLHRTVLSQVGAERIPGCHDAKLKA